MKNLEIILSLLGNTLSLWSSSQKSHFLKQYIKLNTEFYYEKNKDKPDFARLDNLKYKLMLLISAFNSKISE